MGVSTSLIVSCMVSTCFKWTLWFLRFVCFGRGSWANAYSESAAGSQDTSPQATGAGSEVSADSTGDGVADESPDPNSDAGDAAKDPEDN